MGRYRLEYILGRGGFGAVYKGVDLNVSRPCAIKENLDVSIEAQRQFAREATVLANLSHPNLPRVTDHFSIPNKGQYLVMDYIEGDDLATLMERDRVITYTQAVSWAIQVAEALEYLHEQEPPVLHRDIKPANIRVTPRGKPFLVDFGLVKLFDASTHTTLGARAITPGYAPPEQYGRGKTDARTDIYALGATLFNLLTRKEPLESVQRVTDNSHPLVHQCNPQVPVPISLVVAKAMALDPNQRFQTAREMRQALQKALDEGELVSPDLPDQIAAYSEPTGAGVRPDSDRHLAGKPSQPPVSNVSQAQPPRPASHPRPGSQPRPASQPAPARRRSWVTSVLAIVGVLACLTAALFSGGMLFNGNTASATASAAAVQTRSAGVQSTSEALAATIQARQEAQNPFPTPAGLPDWPVKAQETFGPATTGWWTGETSSANFNRVAAQVVQGVYRIQLEPKTSNAIWSSQAPGFTASDSFSLSLDSHQTSGPQDAWRGIIFGLQNKDQYFFFAIRDSGQYAIYQNRQNDWKAIQQGDLANALRPGEMNRLMVLGEQKDFTFYLNGQVVSKQTLSEFTPGAAGIYIEAATAQATGFDFDNLLLRAP